MIIRCWETDTHSYTVPSKVGRIIEVEMAILIFICISLFIIVNNYD